MKRYKPELLGDYGLAARMRESESGEWVKYADVEKMERALKVISTWASFPEEAMLDFIRAKALEALGK
ncbi:MAG: hypothetical protein HQL47_09985 [Gammaproteobacteria bacterium]|nr:hypothetical protein [Gammaproteobacteria bacterium]